MAASDSRSVRALPAVLVGLLLTAGCGQGAQGEPGDCPPSPGASAAGAATHRTATDDPSAVASYWTEERVENARPAPMPSKGQNGPDCPS